MSFLRWLAGPSRKMKIVEGAGGKFRWQAYLDGVYVAQSTIQGRLNPEKAIKMARLVLGRGWEIDPVPVLSDRATSQRNLEGEQL